MAVGFFRSWTAGFVLGVLPLMALADATNLPRVTGEVRIDAVLDEAVWQKAARIDIKYETSPGENFPAKVATVAYLFEDGVNLYVAFDAKDPRPDEIRAYLRDRDTAWNDDFVGIVIDTFNDQRRAFEFFANPLGVQMDLTNDDVNNTEDDSWDAIWDSAGKISADGFIVEMEIPLNQLRFPVLDGMQTWGIDLLRFYPREKRYRFSNNLADESVNCYLCLFDTIQGLESIVPGRDLEIVPTLTAVQNESTENPGVEPAVREDAEIEAGVSIRWGITPDLTANLAINPDFSQIEADAARIEINNQFALFFPEKRPFFLEGADYFSTPIQAVFTRTVADPAVGAKLTGKRGNNTFGVFAAKDEVTNLLFPGPYESDSTLLDVQNNSFVGRYSRGFGDTSSVGGLLTIRDGEGYQNIVAGLDTSWKISDQHKVQVQYLESQTEYPDDVAIEFGQPMDSFKGDAVDIRYDYDSRDWFANLKHVGRSDGFRADSGFVTSVDRETQGVGIGRIWRGPDEAWWTRVRISADWDITHGDGDQVLEREVEAKIGVGAIMQSWTQIVVISRDSLFEGIRFKEEQFRFYTEMQPVGGLQLEFSARFGDRIDYANVQIADMLRIEPSVSWNVNRHLLVDFDAAMLQLDSKEGPNIFDAKVYDLRVIWQFNLRSYLRLTTQASDVEKNPDQYIDPVNEHERDVGAQLLYSYKLNPQTVFFVGYSDRYVNEDDLDGLTLTDRTVFMKIGYAWMP